MSIQMKPTQPASDTPDDSRLTPQIKKRIAIAGGLALLALAMIPVLDSLSKPDTAQTPASTPVSSGRIQLKDNISSSEGTVSLEPVTASEPLTASAAQSQPLMVTAPIIANPANVNANRPASPISNPPPQIAKATPPASSISLPPAAEPARAPANKAATAQVPGSVANTATTKPQPAPASEKAPPLRNIAAAPANSPTPPVVAAVPRTSASPIAPAGSSFGYQVQLGLFSSSLNAEKMLDDLKKRGITARTETRVQMGPFRTRAEAEEAMAQLRSLGYQPLLVPAGQR